VGRVRLAKCSKTGNMYAVKIVDQARFREDSSVSLKKEVEILKVLGEHERVVRVVEIVEDVEFMGTWCATCACTEFIADGTDGHCKNCGSHDHATH
jgi:hypothetical protein